MYINIICRCQASADDYLISSLSIQWMRNRKYLDSDGTTQQTLGKIKTRVLLFICMVQTFTDGGKLLQINDVKQSDIGSYSCIVSTQVDSLVSNMANLIIEEVNRIYGLKFL